MHASLEFSRNIRVLDDDTLRWEFEVANSENHPFSFQHVMHPLMPLENVVDLEIPEFERLYDEIAEEFVSSFSSGEPKKRLFNARKGTAEMLYLVGVACNSFSIIFNLGMRLEVNFSADLFPSLGIWWNNFAYPDEAGCRRSEMAIEPIPGSNATLSSAFEEGTALRVQPRSSKQWSVTWRMLNI